jgi:hypothetical protein
MLITSVSDQAPSAASRRYIKQFDTAIRLKAKIEKQAVNQKTRESLALQTRLASSSSFKTTMIRCLIDSLSHRKPSASRTESTSSSSVGHDRMPARIAALISASGTSLTLRPAPLSQSNVC